MFHISIEGLDGVGKTTVCNLLSEKTGFIYVEKPLKFLFNNKNTYINTRNKINKNSNRTLSAWFYGLSNIFLYEKFRNSKIITDRHILSNYAWSGNEYNEDIFDLILKKIGHPNITVILYADKEIIYERLIKRNNFDKDLKKIKFHDFFYSKVVNFCKTKKIPYILINTNKLSPIKISEKIIKEIKIFSDEN